MSDLAKIRILCLVAVLLGVFMLFAGAGGASGLMHFSVRILQTFIVQWRFIVTIVGILLIVYGIIIFIVTKG